MRPSALRLGLSVLLSTSCVCAGTRSECSDDFDGTFDLIYTWWTNQRQTRTIDEFLRPRRQDAFLGLRTGEHAGVEQQRELVYNLRGAEQFGLLNHVRLVHVLVHDHELDRYGPPIDLNWTHPQLRLVSSSTLGIEAPRGGYMTKVASLRRIPDLHCWAMLLMDDVFPTKTFDVNRIFDFRSRQQIKFKADSWSEGFCDGDGPFTCHGPFFFSTCHFAEVERKYQAYYDHLRLVGEKLGETADVPCLYDSAGVKEGWAKLAEVSDFLKICHTNGGCTADEYRNPTTMFTNIQGNSFSDEYGGTVPKASLLFLHTFFGVPSRFELPGKAAREQKVAISREPNTKLAECKAGAQ